MTISSYLFKYHFNKLNKKKNIHLDCRDWLTVHHWTDNYQINKWFFFLQNFHEVFENTFLFWCTLRCWREKLIMHTYTCTSISCILYRISCPVSIFSIAVFLFYCFSQSLWLRHFKLRLLYSWCERRKVATKETLKCRALLQCFLFWIRRYQK